MPNHKPKAGNLPHNILHFAFWRIPETEWRSANAYEWARETLRVCNVQVSAIIRNPDSQAWLGLGEANRKSLNREIRSWLDANPFLDSFLHEKAFEDLHFAAPPASSLSREGYLALGLPEGVDPSRIKQVPLTINLDFEEELILEHALEMVKSQISEMIRRDHIRVLNPKWEPIPSNSPGPDSRPIRHRSHQTLVGLARWRFEQHMKETPPEEGTTAKHLWNGFILDYPPVAGWSAKDWDFKPPTPENRRDWKKQCKAIAKDWINEVEGMNSPHKQHPDAT